MGDPARDLVGYADRYRELPFEPLQAGFRRRLVLGRVAAHGPRRLLEIGCGDRPLFLDLPDTAVTASRGSMLP